MKLNVLTLVALSTAMFVGCVSEQERLAKAAAEKARQEQLAKERIADEKARQEQLAKEKAAAERDEKINAIAKSTRISYLVTLVKTDDDEGIRKAAMTRLLDIAKDPVSIMKTMQQPAYQVVEDRDKDERPWYSVERRSDGVRIIHVQRRVGRKTGIIRYSEKDLADLCARVKKECEEEPASKTKLLIANLGREGVLKELADVAKNCEIAEIRNAALDVIVLTRSHAATMFKEEFVSSSHGQTDTKEDVVPVIEVKIDPAMTGTSRIRYKHDGPSGKVIMYVSAELANAPDKIESRKKAFLLGRRLGPTSTPRRESFQVCLADITKNSKFPDVRIKAFKNMEPDITLVKEIELKSDDPALRASALKAKEALESARDKHYDDLAEHNYNLALKVFNGKYLGWQRFKNYEKYMVKFLSNYAKADGYGDKKFNGKLMEADKPWQKLVEPRRKLSEEEKNAGKAKLEEFGTQFLPNAYSNYEKIRDQATEIQQMFNEEFPDPFSLKEDSPKWNTYTKLLKGLMKVRLQTFRRHDELCHFYLLHKVGALSGADLAKIDSGKISIWLYEENRDFIQFSNPERDVPTLAKLEDKVRTFAEKQAPETFAFYQRCAEERGATQKLLGELLSDVRIMDITRFELPVVACREKIDFITQTLNALTADFQAWQVEYKTMEKDAATIADLDHKTALKWKGFVELLPSYVKERSNGPMIAANSPMNKYYPCDRIQIWHLNALGFLGVRDLHDLDPRGEIIGDRGGNVVIGEVLDAPTFLTGMDKELFKQTERIGYGDERVATCWTLLDDGRDDGRRDKRALQFSSDISKNGWISIKMLTALGAKWSDLSGRGRSGVHIGGFSRQSVFLARLNEVDAGKAEYVGITHTGMKSATGFGDAIDEAGWFIVKMK